MFPLVLSQEVRLAINLLWGFCFFGIPAVGLWPRESCTFKVMGSCTCKEATHKCEIIATYICKEGGGKVWNVDLSMRTATLHHRIKGCSLVKEKLEINWKHKWKKNKKPFSLTLTGDNVSSSSLQLKIKQDFTFVSIATANLHFTFLRSNTILESCVLGTFYLSTNRG